jgi:hypothetical protein
MKGNAMNNVKFSPYATNKGGKISAPRNTSEGEPRATKTVGDDLRAKANVKRKKG